MPRDLRKAPGGVAALAREGSRQNRRIVGVDGQALRDLAALAAPVVFDFEPDGPSPVAVDEEEVDAGVAVCLEAVVEGVLVVAADDPLSGIERERQVGLDVMDGLEAGNVLNLYARADWSEGGRGGGYPWSRLSANGCARWRAPACSKFMSTDGLLCGTYCVIYTYSSRSILP